MVITVGHVYYHHPGDKQFSLDFVHPEPGETLSRVVGYDDEIAVKVRAYDLEESFYAIYTTSTFSGTPVREMEFDLNAALESVGDACSTIVLRLMDTYRTIVSENEEEKGTPVEAYKQEDVRELADALDRVTWTGSATDVAGRLASNVILNHALPNANHRTGVALIQFYLRRLDPEFSMPETYVEVDPETYDWREWVNSYINESKRLLTVRRKNVLFKHVQGFGATTLERKHGIEIDLSAYELDMHPSEAKEVYAEDHEKLWIDFVEEAVERVGHAELKETPAMSKTEFAAAIRDLE